MASLSAGPSVRTAHYQKADSAAHMRVSSVDHLRGLVMVVMVLDHAREFFMNSRIDPVNLATSYPLLFFTRWVTHFCAPVFVFLAGTGAYLAYAHGKSKPRLALYLLTRGLWLIALEVTLVKLGWMFRLDYTFVLFQVIWAIGGSMIVLSALIFLPNPVLVALGLLIVAGHNTLDGPLSARLAGLGWGATLFRPGGLQPFPGTTIHVAYPLVPWLGVMTLGYTFGPILRWSHQRRRQTTFGMGAGLTLAFVSLRAWNGYGDPGRWSIQPTGWMTVASFLNCQKYPPSLLFLLMTLGPSLMLLAWFDGGAGAVGRRLITLGRVPLFFYLVQWPVVHTLAILVALARGEPVGWFFGDAPFQSPAGYGYGPGAVYLAWAVAVLILYFPSRWFADLKRRRRDVWLSYL
jgi:uncharacterized membrane protein